MTQHENAATTCCTTCDRGRHPLSGAVLSRRSAVAAGAVGLGVAGLSACSSDTDDDTAPGVPSESTATETSGSEEGTALTTLSALPVGTARIFEGDDGPIVVTQPTEGEAVAFSAECTHQGCAVSVDSGTELVCPCHDSRFEATTGEVLQGPAEDPLPSIAITIDGDNVLLTS